MAVRSDSRGRRRAETLGSRAKRECGERRSRRPHLAHCGSDPTSSAAASLKWLVLAVSEGSDPAEVVVRIRLVRSLP